jgi:two-component system, chemotaxis family, sensor kinase Cph1
MSITNLINKDAVSITNCADEPIHIPGSIQPFGFLLGVEKAHFKIVYCSENCKDFFGLSLPDILGKQLSDFFSASELVGFNNYFNKEKKELARPFVFTIKGESYNTTAHDSKGYLVLEFEPFSNELFELPDLYIQTKRFAYHTERADNLKNLCQDVAEQTKAIIGFDRVMIYRFDAAYNGEVIAESKNSNLEPLLGLHYPHTDIPVQARALYVLNPVRMLVDAQYTPVPLYGLNENTQEVETLDLSLSALRSFSPIHIQYLKNMGVAATFSISLIHKGKLWGLIACHHNSPRHIPYYTRLAAHLQAIFLSSQIDVRQIADEFEQVKDTDKKIAALHNVLAEKDVEITNSDNLILLKNLMNADAIIMSYNRKLYSEGQIPAPKTIQPFLQWLETRLINGRYNTSMLMNEYPEAAAFGSLIAGVHYLSLGKNNNDGIVWILQEVEKTVNWGGNPEKAVVKNELNSHLTPRSSFDLWKQSVKHQSRLWRKAEIDAATVICANIQHELHLKTLQEEERRYQSLNTQLQKANDELANMNWISTHDLKEPLRKIQIYASVILENDTAIIPENVKKTIIRMQSSATKMQILIDDLQSYTKVLNKEERFTQVDLNQVLREVRTELIEDLEEKGGKLNIGTLPIIKGIDFQINQLFINLISNAIKFSKAQQSPLITVSFNTTLLPFSTVTAPEDSAKKYYYCVTVSDNGIGFNETYKEDIFKIFHRLHTKEYKGTGIGLAICKKIMEVHDGFIEVSSEEGKGADFALYFPVSS